MKLVEPSVFVVGETTLTPTGLKDMLTEIGVPEWTTDADSDAEVIVEASGKLCYMSFDTKLNDNLTKANTRNNFDYIQQSIIANAHGSVLEHTTVTMAFINVSRIFTHELVRHRVGAAYSQTSGRYVRTGELSFWMPTVFKEDIELAELFEEAILHQETILAKMVEVSRIENMTDPSDFAKKKELTSAFRRIVGNGVANNIMVTYNHRALRHLIEMRTALGAEEEIRVVFNKVFDKVANAYPAFYADAEKVAEKDGIWAIRFAHSKI